MKKTFTLALGIVAGLCLASALYNTNTRPNKKQDPREKLPESEPEEFSLWI